MNAMQRRARFREPDDLRGELIPFPPRPVHIYVPPPRPRRDYGPLITALICIGFWLLLASVIVR